MRAKFRLAISSRCDDMVAEVKGGNFMPPPPAAGGWRGGPAAAGLTYIPYFPLNNNEMDFFGEKKIYVFPKFRKFEIAVR